LLVREAPGAGGAGEAPGAGGAPGAGEAGEVKFYPLLITHYPLLCLN